MKLILIELNEINFDMVNFYLDKGIPLPGFKKIIDYGLVVTKAESKYELLEPWIQWPSVHCGKEALNHQIFRLGDVVSSNEEQFFEKIEELGFSVGAISPMNASNKLRTPAYFIPDPWTKTPCDGSFLSKNISSAISQAVNDNAQSKLTKSSILSLLVVFFALVRPFRYLKMISYAISTFAKPWRKALFLDIFLYEIHKTLLKRKSPDFATLFLNAGAHIQHHYFLNSPFANFQSLKNPSWYIDEHADPVLEMLEVYDEILLDVANCPDTEVIVATGLSQKPYRELKFYYRLKDHNHFLNTVGVVFQTVVPRMTRDFLITFESSESALDAEKKLSSIMVNENMKLFEEIDNRGKDIFLVLTYSSEITKETMITVAGNEFLLSSMVTFVAIKNGEHQGKGFSFFSKGVRILSPLQGSHVSEIHKTVLRFFGALD